MAAAPPRPSAGPPSGGSFYSADHRINGELPVSRLISLVFICFLTCSLLTGCGGSQTPDIIQPGEDYQLTEQEIANAEASTASAADSGFSN